MEKLYKMERVHVNGGTTILGCQMNRSVRNYNIVCGLVGGDVLGEPIGCSKGDVVRKGVCDGTGNGQWTVALFAGHWEVVGDIFVWLYIEMDAFGGWESIPALG